MIQEHFSVVDNGIATTDANGIPNDFMDGNFRDLAVYSLIGLWSTTPNDITPIGDPATAPFFVGTNLLLSLIDIPDVPQLYSYNDNQPSRRHPRQLDGKLHHFTRAHDLPWQPAYVWHKRALFHPILRASPGGAHRQVALRWGVLQPHHL